MQETQLIPHIHVYFLLTAVNNAFRSVSGWEEVRSARSLTFALLTNANK